MPSGKKTVISEQKGNILLVKFNYPKKHNALNTDAYEEITRILRKAATDESLRVIVFTGAGNFYSSGNDLSAVGMPDDSEVEAVLLEKKAIVKELARAFYESPKILIALINGPCLGIAATTAALCDVIYCSDKAYFQTPFTALGLVPGEGSTYLFPRILGKSKANEMLLLNHKMTANEALRFNFVSEVYRHGEMKMKIWPKIEAFSKLPPESLKASKKLVKDLQLEILDKATNLENDALHQRWYSNEVFDAITKFMKRKSKL